ncbi:MAG: hypothetical protein HFI50_14155 [Lachnospiraceae bacterium]|jgi:hypothetical protein|nr:hypothetical protein [Lachnospiraceae bacterium]
MESVYENCCIDWRNSNSVEESSLGIQNVTANVIELLNATGNISEENHRNKQVVTELGNISEGFIVN